MALDLDGLKDLANRLKDDPAAKEALALGKQAVGTVKGMLEAMESSDDEALEVALTRWEDVNRTLTAIGKMDKAIEDAEVGPSITEVLEFVAKAVKVGMTLAALA